MKAPDSSQTPAKWRLKTPFRLSSAMAISLGLHGLIMATMWHNPTPPPTEQLIEIDLTEPDPTPVPEPTAAPEPTAEPQTTPEPEPTFAPEPTLAPEPTTAPEPPLAPQPTAPAVVEPTIAPPPTARPEPTLAPQPSQAPKPEPTPVPRPTVAPQPTARPVPQPTKPVVQPRAQPTTAPKPLATMTPDQSEPGRPRNNSRRTQNSPAANNDKPLNAGNAGNRIKLGAGSPGSGTQGSGAPRRNRSNANEQAGSGNERFADAAPGSKRPRFSPGASARNNTPFDTSPRPNPNQAPDSAPQSAPRGLRNARRAVSGQEDAPISNDRRRLAGLLNRASGSNAGETGRSGEFRRGNPNETANSAAPAVTGQGGGEGGPVRYRRRVAAVPFGNIGGGGRGNARTGAPNGNGNGVDRPGGTRGRFARRGTGGDGTGSGGRSGDGGGRNGTGDGDGDWHGRGGRGGNGRGLGPGTGNGDGSGDGGNGRGGRGGGTGRGDGGSGNGRGGEGGNGRGRGGRGDGEEAGGGGRGGDGSGGDEGGNGGSGDGNGTGNGGRFALNRGRFQRGREDGAEIGRGVFAPGLIGEYFEDPDQGVLPPGHPINWPTLGSAKDSVSKKILTSKTINFDWGIDSPFKGIRNTYWSVRWKGRIFVPKTDIYSFFLDDVDDGGRLYLDGKKIIDVWLVQKSTPKSGKMKLEKGPHDIVLEYVQGPATASSVRLMWESDSFPRELVGSYRPPD